MDVVAKPETAKKILSFRGKKTMVESNLNREKRILAQMERKLATYQVILITLSNAIHEVLKKNIFEKLKQIAVKGRKGILSGFDGLMNLMINWLIYILRSY